MTDHTVARSAQYDQHVALSKALFSQFEQFSRTVNLPQSKYDPALAQQKLRERQHTLCDLTQMITQFHNLQCSPVFVEQLKSHQLVDKLAQNIHRSVDTLVQLAQPNIPIDPESKHLSPKPKKVKTGTDDKTHSFMLQKNIRRDADILLRTIQTIKTLLRAIIYQLPYCPKLGDIVQVPLLSRLAASHHPSLKENTS